MSERALAYSEEPLQHRMLVVYEMAGLSSEFGSYLVRSLLSEGRLAYETVEKTTAGITARKINKQGPTGLIVTTTALGLHAENETRMLTVNVRDDAAQTKAVLQALAEQHDTNSDFSEWHALQSWLAGTDRCVVIPFAAALASAITPVAVRLRRDFRQLLTLIKTHALLHQSTRRRDRAGKVVATIDDYSAVREIVADLVAEGVEASIGREVRETVEAVKALTANSKTTNVQEVARQLNLDKSPAWRRVQKAIRSGFVKNLQKRKAQEARLVLGEQLLPEYDNPVLPEPDAVARLQAERKG